MMATATLSIRSGFRSRIFRSTRSASTTATKRSCCRASSAARLRLLVLLLTSDLDKRLMREEIEVIGKSGVGVTATGITMKLDDARYAVRIVIVIDVARHS